MVAIKSADAARVSAKPDPSYRVILFYGPDSGLVSERASLLARNFAAGNDDPMQMIRLDGDALASDPLRLVDEANTIGLFGGQRTIRISPTSKNLSSAVEPLLTTPPLDSRIIIEGGDLSKTNPLRVAIERAKTALAVPCYSDDGRALGEMIDTMLREAKLDMSREAKSLLVSSLGSDRRISRLEVEKLILHAWGTPRISEEDVALLIGDSASREIATVVDAAFAGRLPVMDAALQKLFGENVDPAQILGGMLRHALSLVQARFRVDQGEPIREAVKTMRGMPYPRMAAAEAALPHWSASALAETMKIIADATAQTRREAQLAQAMCTRALWTIARMAARSGRG
jgi:DNA polymerase III subunit delta